GRFAATCECDVVVERTIRQTRRSTANFSGPTRSTSPRTASVRDAGHGLDRKATRETRRERRTDHPRRTPATSGGTSHGRKHHHQHAAALDARLERLLRKSQFDRTAAWKRSRRCLFADEFCLARSLPPRRRTNQQANQHQRTRNRASRSRSRSTNERRVRSKEARRLLPHR